MATTHGVYATGWYYGLELAEVVLRMGQYARLCVGGRLVEWDAVDGRYVVRGS